jgi:proton-translocating NADH-quinone oxidoreductase chain N
MNVNFFNLFENDFLALFPEIFLVTSTLFLLMYGVIFSTSKQYNYPILIQNVGWLSLICIALTMCLLCHNPIHQSLLFYNTLIIDDFTYFFKILLLSSSFCAILISFDLTHRSDQSDISNQRAKSIKALNAFEYMILILFSTASMLFMISSYDFISMYLTVELQSLCFYVLAASKRNSEFSTEAGLKYFILGAFSSGILLFGCSMIYGFTGITNFGELAKVLTGSDEGSSGIIIGIIFLAVGFLFKLTAAPFHMWAPDVYEGSPTSITAFFSIAPKIAIFGVFLRLFLYSFYDLMLPWQKIILFCSIASMIVGALAAMAQHKIKRLLAYSSIGHIGYILLGLCCATVEGIEALFIYLIVYVIMTINLFAIILSLRELNSSSVSCSVPWNQPVVGGVASIEATLREGDLLSSASQATRRPQESLKTSIGFNSDAKAGTYHFKYISDLGMLAKTNPILAFTLTCTLFSMAGIPPLAGFCSKFYIFFAALSSSLYLLAFVGVLTSVVSCFYYIRLIKIMYFEKPTKFIAYQPMDREKSIIIGITLFFMIFFFFYPSPLFLVAHKVAISLSL